MTYQQTQYMAIIKRILGWLIFIPALLSTSISILSFFYTYTKNMKIVENTHELYPVINDFIQVFLEMIRSYTHSINYFWNNSPVPTLGSGWSSNNIWFILIYILIFVGLALNASGARISRQLQHVKERLEDLLIVEELKGDQAPTYQELITKVRFPHHSIFLQFYRLYFLPAIIAIAVYYTLRYLHSLGF